MSDFNWNDHPIVDAASAPAKSGAFDWNDHPVVTAPGDQPSMVGSAVRKFAQGASSGFSDEMAGAAEAAGRTVGLSGVGGPMKNIGINPDGPTLDSDKIKQAYQLGRDHERQTLALDAKAHPAISAVADLGGALVSPVNKVVGPLGALSGGAVIGGTQALGNSDAQDIAGLAKDTAIGAGLGGLVGKVADVAAPYVGAATQNLGAKLSDSADYLSAKALGAERATVKKFGKDAVQKAGRYGLDNNVVTALGNTEDKIAANEATKAAAMDSRKAAYDTIDNAGASQFSPTEVAANAKEAVLGGKNMAHDDVKALAETLDPHLSNILSRGDQNISMDEAQKLVESLGKSAKFDTSRSNQANDVAKQVYQSVRSSINDAAEKGADSLGVDGLRETIEDANAKYSSGKVAEALLKNKQARESGNKILGHIADAGAVGYGLTTGDYKHAAEVIAIRNGLNKFGPQLAAKGLDSIATKLMGVPEISALAEKSPAAFQSILSHFESSSAMPAKVADAPPPKGQDKWANDGAQKLITHAPDDKDTVEKAKGAMSDPKVKQLLIQASDLKPNTKAMDAVMTKLKSKLASGED